MKNYSKPLRFFVLYCAALCVLTFAACGGDDDEGGAVAPVDAGTRALPSLGDPPTAADLDAALQQEPVDAGFVSPTVDCCDVTFAIADETADEETALLKGTEPPLEDGVELMHADRKWSATVCMPLAYDATYHYEFGTVVDDEAPLFIDTRVNENAPTVDDVLLGVVNRFSPAESCAELEGGVHSQLE